MNLLRLKLLKRNFIWGEVKSIEQTTPSVTDAAPVIKELKANNIVVLRNHGVVAMGPDLFRAFVLIQELEEQLKMDLVAVLLSANACQPGTCSSDRTCPQAVAEHEALTVTSTPGNDTMIASERNINFFPKNKSKKLSA